MEGRTRRRNGGGTHRVCDVTQRVPRRGALSIDGRRPRPRGSEKRSERFSPTTAAATVPDAYTAVRRRYYTPSSTPRRRLQSPRVLTAAAAAVVAIHRKALVADGRRSTINRLSQRDHSSFTFLIFFFLLRFYTIAPAP